MFFPIGSKLSNTLIQDLSSLFLNKNRDILKIKLVSQQNV